MPYLRLSISKKISPEDEQRLVDGLGAALSKIPGKDPQWTMVEVNDGLKMYFGGKKQDDMVFVDVKYAGRFQYRKKKEFTQEAFNVINAVLGTPKDKICLIITEYNNWGAVGDFRDIYYSD
jgi:phenylpyruvate tautomerase PptA (4-oxalocrotonate tautomerase family)